MKFTVNTKPLNSALAIAIVDSNVSKYYQKSTLVQLTMTRDSLRINTEANSIITEVSVKGSGDGEGSILIDAILFKKLISTITTTQLDLSFDNTCVTVTTGSGSYNLPKMLDSSEAQLNRPVTLDQADIENGQDISKEDWKFIKSNQMYAKAESEEFPVYMYVFAGENGDILVGDFTNSIFTHSTCNVIDENCLISDSIVNMFNSVPDGSIITKKDGNYVIYAKTDAFEYVSAFVPKYESDEFGTYNADAIISMLSTFDKDHITVKASDITNILNQVQLLSKRIMKLHISVGADYIEFSDSNMKSKVQSEITQNTTYSIDMNPVTLKNIISHCPDEKIEIYPSYNEDNAVVSIVVTSGKLTVVAAGVE